jgi:nucleoid DNA-binding protein
MSDLKEELIEKLSAKYHLSKKEIRGIVDHQFKFTAKIITEGKFHSVRLPYFGVFKPNLKHKKYLDDRND